MDKALNKEIVSVRHTPSSKPYGVERIIFILPTGFALFLLLY
jgi:hypothetical protein